MKLSNATIRPGKILSVLPNGNIKATAPGLFSMTDDLEKLPPIMPFNSSGVFSQPKKLDEVWIMNFTDNPQQLYWFKKGNVMNNKNIPNTEQNVEVLCNREVKGEWCTIYFSDGSGWVIGKGSSIINITSEGDIVLSTGAPNRIIDINKNSISLGSYNESAHPAAFGDCVEDVFEALCLLLSGVALKAMANPYTAAIGLEIMSKLPAAMNKIETISSTNVTLD